MLDVLPLPVVGLSKEEVTLKIIFFKMLWDAEEGLCQKLTLEIFIKLNFSSLI